MGQRLRWNAPRFALSDWQIAFQAWQMWSIQDSLGRALG
jgi:hypothetical protein